MIIPPRTLEGWQRPRRLPRNAGRFKYKPHYAGKRGMAAERNRRQMGRGLIPKDQILRGPR